MGQAGGSGGREGGWEGGRGREGGSKRDVLLNTLSHHFLHRCVVEDELVVLEFPQLPN